MMHDASNSRKGSQVSQVNKVVYVPETSGSQGKFCFPTATMGTLYGNSPDDRFQV